MSSTLDQKTNLPKLPEGFFWRVTKKEYPNDGYYYGSRSYYSQPTLEMIENSTKEVTTGKLWWKKTAVVPNEIIRFAGRIRSILPIKYDAKNLVIAAPKGFEISGYQGYYERTTVEPKTILETAERILKKQTAAKIAEAQIAAEEALYGDYPPKSL